MIVYTVPIGDLVPRAAREGLRLIACYYDRIDYVVAEQETAYDLIAEAQCRFGEGALRVTVTQYLPAYDLERRKDGQHQETRLERVAPYWVCDECRQEVPKVRQCPHCGTIGMVWQRDFRWHIRVYDGPA